MGMFHVERTATLSIIVMPRRLNVARLPAFIASVQRELAGRPEGIVLDLCETDAIDMTALAGIVEMHKQCAIQGVELRLRAPHESVRRLLAVTRLDRALHLESGPVAEAGLRAAAE